MFIFVIQFLLSGQMQKKLHFGSGLFSICTDVSDIESLDINRNHKGEKDFCLCILFCFCLVKFCRYKRHKRQRVAVVALFFPLCIAG